MKYKTAELEGALLDLAVAKAVQLNAESALNFGLGCPDWLDGFRPSRIWNHGGQIIEREQISVAWPDADPLPGHQWHANIAKQEASWNAYGPTPLIAAMRVYAYSKFGYEIDL